jgi:PPOX class probable F420-dependent enzyme
VVVCHHAGHADWLKLGGKGGHVGPDDAREFVTSNHRAVLITRRSSGGLQTSPVLVGVDDEGKLVVSNREGAYKTRNLRRDPTAVLCVFSDRFFGRWVQLEGTAQVVSLPEAMDGLVDYYRRISGEHPDWDDYRRAMEQQRRVLVRVSIGAVGPTRAG